MVDMFFILPTCLLWRIEGRHYNTTHGKSLKLSSDRGSSGFLLNFPNKLSHTFYGDWIVIPSSSLWSQLVLILSSRVIHVNEDLLYLHSSFKSSARQFRVKESEKFEQCDHRNHSLNNFDVDQKRYRNQAEGEDLKSSHTHLLNIENDETEVCSKDINVDAQFSNTSADIIDGALHSLKTQDIEEDLISNESTGSITQDLRSHSQFSLLKDVQFLHPQRQHLPHRNFSKTSSSMSIKEIEAILNSSRKKSDPFFDQDGSTLNDPLSYDLVQPTFLPAKSTNEADLSFAHRIASYGYKNNWQNALKLFSSNDHPDVMACGAAINACSKSAKWQYALQIVQKMRVANIPRNPIIYNSCITACFRAKKYDIGLELFDAMKLDGVSPNEIVFNTCIYGCVISQEYGRALSLWDEARSDNLVPALPTWNMMLNVYRKLKRPKDALKTLQTMKELRIADTISYNTCISACASCNLWSAGLKLFQDMKLTYILRDRFTYHSLIFSCSKVGQWKIVFGLINEAEKENILLDIITFNCALGLTESEGQWEIACRLLEKMENFGILPDLKSFYLAIRACAKDKNSQVALRLFRKCWDLGFQPDQKVYNACISIFESSGKYDAVIKLIDHAIENDIQLDVLSINGYFRACEETLDWHRALTIIESTKTRGFLQSPRSYMLCMKLFRKAIKKCAIKKEQVTSVAAIVEELIAEIETKNFFKNAKIYHECLHTCYSLEMYLKSLSLFEDMRRKNIIPYKETYEIILLCCGKGSHVWRTRELIQEMRRKRVKVNSETYSLGIRTLLKGGMEEEALALLLDARKRRQANCKCYAPCVMKFVQNHKYKNALELLDDMDKNMIPMDMACFCLRFVALIRLRSVQESIKLLEEIKEKKYSSLVGLFNSCMNLCLETKSYEKGIGIFLSLRKSPFQPNEGTFRIASTLYSEKERKRVTVDSAKEAFYGDMK